MEITLSTDESACNNPKFQRLLEALNELKTYSARKTTCGEALERVHGVPFERNANPDWLLRGTAFDFYNQELGLAIDISENPQVEDYKTELCEQNNVEYVTIPNTVSDDCIEDYILERISGKNPELEIPDLRPLFGRFAEQADSVPTKELFAFVNKVQDMATEKEEFDRKQLLELFMQVIIPIMPRLLTILCGEVQQTEVTEPTNSVQAIVAAMMPMIMSSFAAPPSHIQEEDIYDLLKDRTQELQ